MFAGFGGALGERRPVDRQDRRPRRQLDSALQVLAPPQAGEDEPGVPVDTTVGDRQLEWGFHLAEGDGGCRHLHRDDRGTAALIGVVRALGVELAQGRHLRRLAVGGGKIVGADRAPRLGIQLPVHRVEVLALPGGGKALGHLLLRRAGAARGSAPDEGDDGDERQRQGAGYKSTTSLNHRCIGELRHYPALNFFGGLLVAVRNWSRRKSTSRAGQYRNPPLNPCKDPCPLGR